MSPVDAFVHRFEPGTAAATLLLLHGTGGDEHQLIDLGHQLAPGIALLSPLGKVMEGGVAARFFARRAMGDLDLDDLRVRAEELAGWVREACAVYGRDAGRL
ncbi:MAG: phospholipase/carboxylesterase, partial [Solirubrobacterales bacterium]|nr:phospholipase/carboxylesterase [Solirubrobacterales bacterium]